MDPAVEPDIAPTQIGSVSFTSAHLSDLHDALLRGSVIDSKQQIKLHKVSDEVVASMVLHALEHHFQKGSLELGRRLADEFRIRKPLRRRAVLNAVLGLVHQGKTTQAKDLLVSFPLREKEIAKKVEYALERALSTAEVRTAASIVNTFEIPRAKLAKVDLQQAAQLGMARCLLDGRRDEFLAIMLNFVPEREFCVSQKTQKEVDRKICELLRAGKTKEFIALKNGFAFQPEKLRELNATELANQGIQAALTEGRVADALELRGLFNIESKFEEWQRWLPSNINKIIDNFELASISALASFVRDHARYFDLVTSSNLVPLLLRHDLSMIKSAHLRLDEAETLLQAQIDLCELVKDDEKLFANLTKFHPEWKDRDGVVSPMKLLSERFGPSIALEFSRRRDLSRAQCLKATAAALSLHNQSGMSAVQFAQNVLLQVAKDNAVYREGSSYDRLIEISNSELIKPAELVRALTFAPPKLIQIMQGFEHSESPFTSWRKLRTYSDLVRIAAESKLLEALAWARPKLGTQTLHFIENVLFHQGVQTREVLKLLQNPRAFFDNSDEDTQTAIHELRSAQRLLEIPHLDLDAYDLMQSLASPRVAAINSFPPLEMRWNESIDAWYSNVRDLVSDALGSRANAISGKAQRPSKLYQQIKGVLDPLGLSVADYLEGAPIAEAIEQQLRQHAFNEHYGIKSKTIELIAQVHSKDDPLGSVAGDDTVSCRVFHSGKNIHYMLSPAVGFFTLAIQHEDGSRRVLAESVITPAVSIGKNAPKAWNELETGCADVSAFLDESILKSQRWEILCDNQQISKLYQREPYLDIVIYAYKVFFNAYLDRFADTHNFSRERILIGQGYSEALYGLCEIQNDRLPLTPMTYSDARGAWLSQIEFSDTQSQSVNFESGVRELKFEDSLLVSHLEGRVFPEELKVYHAAIQNSLNAQAISNALKKRPNLSFKYLDQDGIFRGYLIAYQGKFRESGIICSEPIVYVAGIASDPKSSVAAARLLSHFVQTYKTNYCSDPEVSPPAIYAELREKTSYKLLKRHFDRLAKETGYNFEIIERSPEKMRDESMHRVLITANSTNSLAQEFQGENLLITSRRKESKLLRRLWRQLVSRLSR